MNAIERLIQHGHPTPKALETRKKDLDAVLPRAMACKSYEELRSAALRSPLGGEIFRAAHWAHGADPSKGAKGGAAHTIALTAVREMKALSEYLHSDKCMELAIAAQEERDRLTAKVKPADQFAWADDAAEYYGGGSVD